MNHNCCMESFPLHSFFDKKTFQCTRVSLNNLRAAIRKKVATMASIPKQAKRRHEIAANQLNKHVESMNAILDAVEERPELWQRPELAHLHEFVCDVQTHPDTFPLPQLHHQMIEPLDTAGTTLSKGFAAKLYSGDSFASQPLMQPVVLVIRKGEHRVILLTDDSQLATVHHCLVVLPNG
jgi:transcription elongation factor Elf1